MRYVASVYVERVELYDVGSSPWASSPHHGECARWAPGPLVCPRLVCSLLVSPDSCAPDSVLALVARSFVSRTPALTPCVHRSRRSTMTRFR